MSDEGFHEIQLNGKQLIFLFMTAAVVLVVAFLSGVLVGRGVRLQKDATLSADAGVSQPADPNPSASAAPAAQSAAAPPPVTAIAPPTPADEDVSYDSRLQGKEAPKEPPLKTGSGQAPVEPAARTAKTAAPDAPPPAKPAPEAAKAKAEAALPGEPAGPGYYLKIVAYRDRAQAEAVATRLTGKGYSSYIVPLTGRGVFSVRVGKYKTRREADAARRRLEKEEQFKPLISR